MSDPTPKTIRPKAPGLLTRRELALYLRVDPGEIQGIAQRFGLQTLEDHSVERAIWRQVLRLLPVDEAAADLLRQQLQDINWVSRKVGKVPSTIRDKICAGTFQYSHGVQLGAAVPDRAEPRMRRFVPAVIEAQRRGDDHPFQDVASPPTETDPACAETAEAAKLADSAPAEPAPDASDNVFGWLTKVNAE